MKIKTLLFLIVLSNSMLFAQTKKDLLKIEPGIEYEARLFLTETQNFTFKKVFPDFDEDKAEKKWEWKDVDPLGLFTPEENRKKRRELFLYEHSAYAIHSNEDETPEIQKAYKIVVQNQINDAEILYDKTDIKIIIPFTDSYDTNIPKDSLMEKISTLGLGWSETGGNNLYIYNGIILLGKYKSGYVSIVNTKIDNPFSKYQRNKKKTK